MKASAMGHRKIKSPPRFPQHRNNTFLLNYVNSYCALGAIGLQAAAVLYTSDSPTTRCCSHMRCFRRQYFYCCRPEMNTYSEFLALCYLCCCNESSTTSTSVSRTFTVYYVITDVLPKPRRLCYRKFLNAPPQYLH